ncbi:hypothetical protein [Phyllobacterium sp. SB3]|uniref:hypothetical protein n=1 Tax=Phyllobacterium sp. SB3 TaxID=3156073 RepID=UPI0032AED2EF
MADFFTHFSCLLDVGTPANAARALELYSIQMAQNAAEDPPSDAFLVSVTPEHGATRLWIRDDVTGDPQSVIDFVLRCAEAFQLSGRWGFQWAGTCSRPRVDAFSGGAHVLDLATGETVAWISTPGWLADRLAEGRPL